MLKKFAPSWGPSQTAAVQHLKRITQHHFPLKIPTKEQRILQTDASDEYWSAVTEKKLIVPMLMVNSKNRKNIIT